MNIVLNRVDDRLVHGQVLASWAKRLQVGRIIVADDILARDALAEAVFSMSLPGKTTIKIMDVAQCVSFLQSNDDGTPPPAILLMKNIQTVKALWDLGYRPDSLNIGGMSAGASRRQLCRGVYAAQEEIDLLRYFQREGTDVYVQVVWAENRVRLEDLI